MPDFGCGLYELSSLFNLVSLSYTQRKESVSKTVIVFKTNP